MTEIQDTLLAKIRALLANAEGTDNPAEAEAYTEKASELMAQYGIERAMLAGTDPSTDKIGVREIQIEAPYALDKRGLLTSVAHALGCRSTLCKNGRRVWAEIIGFDSDLDRVETLFTSLLVQAAQALAVTSVSYGESTAAFRRSWYSGYAYAVYRRLSEVEKRARAQAETSVSASGRRSTALVLVDRAQQVNRYYDDYTKNLDKARPRKLSGSGARQGFRAGQEADLGGRKVSGTSRRALGGA